MERFIINVPKGIRYISEWQNFSVKKEPHILDKKIPGCGFTEWILTNNENVILCSPRLMLIENKADQHSGEVMTVIGSGVELGIDKDLEEKHSSSKVSGFVQKLEEHIKARKQATRVSPMIGNIQDGLEAYIKERRNKPLKIITTYDSFPILKDVLEFNKILGKFHIYVDEFQSIFTDSRFKVDTETKFLDSLQDLSPCYVSATPMMETYLDRMPEFSKLPYIELDWEAEDPIRTIKPNLKVRTCRSIISKATEIIESYIRGEYEKAFQKDGSVVESKEATFFCNSVNNIISIIRNAKLTSSQVNILCARTEENEEKIKSKLGKDFEIGTVPLFDAPRKMFTMCTRTVYLGADFYSDNSRTFIFSDANIDTLSVDISLDLPQIMGRQRLNSNPWKNQAEFYYKTLFRKGDDKNKITQEMIDKKIKSTEAAISLVENAISSRDKDEAIRLNKLNIAVENYKSNYLSIAYKDGEEIFVPNNLVLISEQRAFDIQNVDYSDRFTMFNTIDSVLGTNTKQISYEVGHFWNEYKKLTRKEEKLKLFCESNLSNEARQQIEEGLDISLKNALTLGYEELKKLDYGLRVGLDKILSNNYNFDKLSSIIYSRFKVGDKLSKNEIKERLNSLYQDNDIKKTAKANDIEEWFETKRSDKSVNGKRIAGVELIKKLK